ncbi:hypothetical protein ACFX14_035819 [Malus domestica]
MTSYSSSNHSAADKQTANHTSFLADSCSNTAELLPGLVSLEVLRRMFNNPFVFWGMSYFEAYLHSAVSTHIWGLHGPPNLRHFSILCLQPKISCFSVHFCELRVLLP